MTWESGTSPGREQIHTKEIGAADFFSAPVQYQPTQATCQQAGTFTGVSRTIWAKVFAWGS
jgi:hypothetical protein